MHSYLTEFFRQGIYVLFCRFASTLGSAVVSENNIAFMAVSCIVQANKVRPNKLAATRPSCGMSLEH